MVPKFPDGAVNFIVASDLGRNGYYRQKPIAELMGEMAGKVDAEFIAAAGDVHHFEGVRSVNDPLWMTNFELVYSHPELMIDWFPILGNHEYRGSTSAVLDYAGISRRWSMPGRYYTKNIKVNDKTSCCVVFIDTTPLIDKYRSDSVQYPDAYKQDMNVQLKWIDSVLTVSKEKWKVVIGHHPVFAQTSKNPEERDDLQKRLMPILEKHGVDFYFAGHIHNFQHIKPKASHVDYIVNSSASLSRSVKKMDGTVFCSPDEGFTICSVADGTLSFYFVNYEGKVIYSYSKSKKAI